MSELRKRQNRFKPKSEIEWLDRDSRKEHRRTIAVLTDLTMALEKRAVLTPAQDQQIRALTQSDAIDTRLNGMWDILEQTENAYLEKLAAMGPHDLSAYHEFVNPHEPPAEHHYFMCDHLMRVEAGEIATLILALPPGAAKALALDTPIPTPNGWTTMGELKVGDKVFDENGEPCSVTWVSPVWKNRPVYKVETDCGDMIIADREHEWLVCRDRESGVFEIKETHALLPKWGKRPMVKRAKALVTDESDLPIDPYLLGVWLGDGTSASVSITSSTEDRVWLRSEIERLGYKTTDRAAKDLFGVVGVRDRFVSLGLLNDPHHKTHGRKHIPQAYMRASYRQRLALVQGMVDSDGTVCKRRGAATFCNINKELALSFRELVRSLGVKAGWSVGRAVFNGVDHGEVYRVSFYHEEAARMPRKAALCRNQSRTPNTYLEITPNGFADTVCIEVDSPSHLFLCGESMTPTHNSTYSSRTFAQWCLGRNPDWRVLACGHALALDTEVPTPHGFKTVESLKVGDEVFADDGSVTVVTAKSPVFTDHECFVATVGDQEIIVDAEHLWTLDASTLNALGERTVRSTAYLSKLRQNDFCGFRLVDNLPVHYAEKELIVEPYLLGLWLGDGLSEDGRIACEAGDKTELMGYIGEACNPTKNPNRFSVIGLAASLRDLSVLGDKHVPEIYKRGSIDQRWALIQGLMDSDGSVTKEGDCAFHNTNYGLIQAVREILFSLGVKNTVYAVPMRGSMTRPAWRVHFKNDRAFRLRRKKLRAKSSKKHRRVKFNATTRVPTQCITIAHPSKTFLVTRSYVPTHNSQKFCEDEFSKPNRTALDSPQFAAVFPDVQLNPMEKGASFWRLMGWRGSYACRGALAGTAGLRARIILGDDLFKNAADAMSEVVRSNIWRWWTADVMSRRLPNAPMVLVNCLTAETPVRRPDGSWTPIADLKIGDEVSAYDKNTHTLCTQVVENWAEQPEDNIYEVHTGNGMVRCNGRHPFWVMKYRYSGKYEEPCWVNAEDLSVRDRVLIAGLHDGTDTARLTEEEAWVLGLFFGDGCVSRSFGRAPWKLEQLYTRLSTSRNRHEQEVILEKINRVFGVNFRFKEVSHHGGVSTTFETNVLSVGRWLQEHGLFVGVDSKHKRVPCWMFNQPAKVRAAFLAGFVEADGYVSPTGQTSITLCNENLVRDLRAIILSLGYRATTVRRYTQFSTIPGRTERFFSERFRVTYREVGKSDDSLFWKGVTKLVNTNRREKVYDIQVSNTHNFLADNIVVSNTLWHSDDVPNKLKALSEENPAALPQPFVFINLPAEAGDDDPLGRRPGEWLWCKEQQDDGFYTINDYETKRATMPPSLWSALYLGQPLDRMGDYISEDQFHRYEKPPVNRQGHEMQWVKTVMSIDTASTGKDRADYTAILIFRKHVDGTHYLVDVWRDKVTLEKVVRVIAKLMRHWQVNHAIVEDSGMGAQLLENYQGKLPAPLVSYTPAGKGSKDFRFDAAAPWITSGKVLFPKEAPWLANFINELVAFPNGANDDQVDAFSMYTDCELKTRAGGTKPLRMRG